MDFVDVSCEYVSDPSAHRFNRVSPRLSASVASSLSLVSICIHPSITKENLNPSSLSLRIRVLFVVCLLFGFRFRFRLFFSGLSLPPTNSL